MTSKSEIRSTKSETNSKSSNSKRYDLEERTFLFAKNIRIFLSETPKTFLNIEDSKQLLRSSGSVGANYREANDSLSKKDFVMRCRISRKEVKESRMWLCLVDLNDVDFEKRILLINESTELLKIFSAIISKST